MLDVENQPVMFADVDKDHVARLGDRVGIRIRPGRLMPSLEPIVD
jgi:hypothetical protein